MKSTKRLETAFDDLLTSIKETTEQLQAERISAKPAARARRAAPVTQKVRVLQQHRHS